MLPGEVIVRKLHPVGIIEAVSRLKPVRGRRTDSFLLAVAFLFFGAASAPIGFTICSMGLR